MTEKACKLSMLKFSQNVGLNNKKIFHNNVSLYTCIV